MTNRTVIAAAVAAERIRQDALHGPELDLPLSLARPEQTSAFLEACRDRVAQLTDAGQLTFEALIECELAEACAETDPRRQIAELVQVSALAQKAAEAVAAQHGITL